MKTVAGRPATPYDGSEPLTIGPAGYGCGCRCSKDWNPAVVSWLSAPTKATCWCATEASASTPASSTQGPHHEAQKFTTTGLPCSSQTLTWSPAGVWMASLGAVLPSTGGFASAACCRPQASQ